MPKTPFVWKAELGGAPDSAFSAQLGSVTYYAVTRSYGHPAYIEVRGASRGLKRLAFGQKIEAVGELFPSGVASSGGVPRSK